jgi:hypothetical protein
VKLRLAFLLTAILVIGVTAETASAHTVSKRAALAKTGKVAKRAAAQTNGVLWFAGACKRRSAHKVVCWGGVAYRNGEGCIQKVVVTAASHANRRLRGRRAGRTYCGQVPSGSGGGTGGGGGSPVVCGIRQSVCI